MSLVEPPVGRAEEIQQEELVRRQEAARQRRPPTTDVESPSSPTDLNGDGKDDGTLGEVRLAALNAVADAEAVLAKCCARREEAAKSSGSAKETERQALQEEEDAQAVLREAQRKLAYTTGIQMKE